MVRSPDESVEDERGCFRTEAGIAFVGELGFHGLYVLSSRQTVRICEWVDE